ncbi:MAG TPA: hypothetical protein PLB67_01325 [Candidatus Hydrogenedentes bacterium]|jgi:hypothetical protein|nr:hypothetical protein [Candidatus Hydrogenedentota bacterium]MDY0033626.1 hypothetical protein [FCB group bacterium]HNZ18603.1 hypothetical protein [Candidatus Hydrogenedentota bacterium]HOH33948.1 hypothetical protein [Candidatus Hydrogenedentota bacterium]HPA03042.1 hypothetical protein [Candidatus Hydrogenedentota bacterium]
MTHELNRRTFMISSAALMASGMLTRAHAADTSTLLAAPRAKHPARVRGAFFYPPREVVLEGKCEDSWSKHQWFTWPGNQFEPEAQQATFEQRLADMTRGLSIALELDRAPIYTDAGIQAFIADITANKPEALLLFNFWNSFSAKIVPILDAYDGPIILYHPLGANHQLPPERFRTEKGLQYIHSIEHWDALERGLRAVHAKTRMAQSRLLRVSGRLEKEADDHVEFFDLPVHGVPAGYFNDLYDATEITPEMTRLAAAVRRRADNVTGLEKNAFLDAVRAHAAVLALMDKYDADAITIECLFLKHRKPCLSFSINNGALVPCGCENDLNASLSLMLGANLFGRGGFQHNPEFDTEENLYFASHCTCTTKLHGPDAKDAPYALRPFFHQMPKTLALDVDWPAGERITLAKYHRDENRLDAWCGDIIDSPQCPPSGGCATRVLARMDNVDDICSIYPGPHPVVWCGDFGRHAKTFAQLYQLEIRTNC